MALLNVDNFQGDYQGLSGVNYANTQSWLTNTEVNGANTYAVLRSRVAAKINAAGVTNEAQQFGNALILPSLDVANRAGTLTDARLNGLTTFAQVVALFTADGLAPSTYANDLAA